MSAFRVIFDSRGAEIVDPVPYEPSVRLGRPPRESLLEQMQRMIMRQKMDEQDTIRDEADMMEDQLDFEDTFDNDGLTQTRVREESRNSKRNRGDNPCWRILFVSTWTPSTSAELPSTRLYV
jgi:hypothetical protein